MATAESIQSYTLPTDSSSRYVPCTRYADNDGKQEPILRSIFNPLPEGSKKAGPIYLLSQKQADKQNSIDNRWATPGGDYIATELQDECEYDHRVLYPIYVETDNVPQIGLKKGLDVVRGYIDEVLNTTLEDCLFYFSGGRSVHAHVPLFATSKSELDQTKECARQYCEQEGVDIDYGIYSRKRQFRLPGVELRNTGIRKRRLNPTADDLNHAALTGTATPPNCFAEVIAATFGDKARKVGLTAPDVDGPPWFDPVDNLPDPVELVFTEETEKSRKGAVIEAQPEYDAKEFSPYAPRSGDQRSVAVVKVRGGAFCRRDVQQGTALLPTFVYGAVGRDGEFTKTNTPTPLQLSPPDYEKYENQEFTEGDCLVVIGGLSNHSRLISIDEYGAVECGKVLADPQTDSPKAEVEAYLEAFHDAETGESGASTDYERSASRSTGGELTDAQKLRQQIEIGDRNLTDLTHTERSNVANSLLTTHGWDATWEWFKEQYGPSFKRDVTYNNLKHIAHSYPDNSDVEVPPSPPAA